MIVSAFGFSTSITQAHVILDPSRVAAQVVLESDFSVLAQSWRAAKSCEGSRPAASIWTVAAIGLAVGGGASGYGKRMNDALRQAGCRNDENAGADVKCVRCPSPQGRADEVIE